MRWRVGTINNIDNLISTILFYFCFCPWTTNTPFMVYVKLLCTCHLKPRVRVQDFFGKWSVICSSNLRSVLQIQKRSFKRMTYARLIFLCNIHKMSTLLFVSKVDVATKASHFWQRSQTPQPRTRTRRSSKVINFNLLLITQQSWKKYVFIIKEKYISLV